MLRLRTDFRRRIIDGRGQHERVHEDEGRRTLPRRPPSRRFHSFDLAPTLVPAWQDHTRRASPSDQRRVVTTLGPRKPQRSASTASCHRKNLDEDGSAKSHSPTPPNRVYLETSFTSLQSQSCTSSMTNGYYSTTSQQSPLPLTNIGTLLLNQQRARSTEIPASSPSIQVISRARPSRSRLSLNIRPTTLEQRPPPKRIDLIHDDWLGLAPLASPESLSEVSSISSRASFTTNLDKIQPLSTSYELKTPKVMRRTPKIINNLSTCADDIRNVRYFQKLGQLSKHLRRPSQNGSSVTNSSSNLSFESAGSNKCHSNEEHIVVDGGRCRNIKEEAAHVTTDVTNTSGESDEFQSAEEILESVIEKAGCAEFFSSKISFLETHFDETMFKSEPPPPAIQLTAAQEIDPDFVSNFAIDLNLDEEHRSSQFSQVATTTDTTSKPNSVDSGSTGRIAGDVKNVTFNPEVINIDSCVGGESERKPKRPDRWNLRLPLKHKKVKAEAPVAVVIKPPEQVPKTILCSKRRNSEDDFFSRTEALPLLSGLGNVSTSPNFVRRKKYVYPTVTVLSRDESSL